MPNFENQTVQSNGENCSSVLNAKTSLKMSAIGCCKKWIERHKRGSNKTRFEYCLDSQGNILYLWGGILEEAESIQNGTTTWKIAHGWTDYIYRQSSVFASSPRPFQRIQSRSKGATQRENSCGWIDYTFTLVPLLIVNQLSKQVYSLKVILGRQTCFFTAVDPMNEPIADPPHEVRQPRKVPSRTRWKLQQDSVYWFDLQSAQIKGLVFWQTQ